MMRARCESCGRFVMYDDSASEYACQYCDAEYSINEFGELVMKATAPPQAQAHEASGATAAASVPPPPPPPPPPSAPPEPSEPSNGSAAALAPPQESPAVDDDDVVGFDDDDDDDEPLALDDLTVHGDEIDEETDLNALLADVAADSSEDEVADVDTLSQFAAAIEENGASQAPDDSASDTVSTLEIPPVGDLAPGAIPEAFGEPLPAFEGLAESSVTAVPDESLFDSTPDANEDAPVQDAVGGGADIHESDSVLESDSLLDGDVAAGNLDDGDIEAAAQATDSGIFSTLAELEAALDEDDEILEEELDGMDDLVEQAESAWQQPPAPMPEGNSGVVDADEFMKDFFEAPAASASVPAPPPPPPSPPAQPAAFDLEPAPEEESAHFEPPSVASTPAPSDADAAEASGTQDLDDEEELDDSAEFDDFLELMDADKAEQARLAEERKAQEEAEKKKKEEAKKDLPSWDDLLASLPTIDEAEEEAQFEQAYEDAKAPPADAAVAGNDWGDSGQFQAAGNGNGDDDGDDLPDLPELPELDDDSGLPELFEHSQAPEPMPLSPDSVPMLKSLSGTLDDADEFDFDSDSQASKLSDEEQAEFNDQLDAAAQGATSGKKKKKGAEEALPDIDVRAILEEGEEKPSKKKKKVKRYTIKLQMPSDKRDVKRVVKALTELELTEEAEKVEAAFKRSMPVLELTMRGSHAKKVREELKKLKCHHTLKEKA